MNYIPSFDNDIFISYSHKDNKPIAQEEGWVEQFHNALKTRLEQVLGDPAVVWRDKKLQGNDKFDATIVEQLSKTAALVSILSPSYINSEWCIKELQEFFCCPPEKPHPMGILYSESMKSMKR